MKKQYKVYLTVEDYNKLLLKASELGFSGRGAISSFLSKLSQSDFAFLDSNLKKVLGLLKVSEK